MDKKNKKLTAEEWQALKLDYLTTELSIRELCKKYGCGKSSIQYRQKRENWQQQREDYRTAILEKAKEKIGDKQVDIFAAEWAVLNGIEELLQEAIKVHNNFKTSYFVGKDKMIQKFDFDALLKATTTVEKLESLKRRIKGVLKANEKQSLDIKREYLEIEKEKNKPVDAGEVINVIELPAILEQTTQEVKEQLKNASGEGAKNGRNG